MDVARDRMFGTHGALIMQAAFKHGLPTVVGVSDLLRDGALLSLSIDEEEVFHALAYFLDKILRGAKPADLPVQQPTKFLIGINLKTAKALGLTISPTLLAQTDEVIE